MSETQGDIAPTDIAIVGMSGRFPGCRNIDEFWANLRDGVECIRTFTDDELLARGVPPSLLNDPSYVKAGGLIDEFDRFDAGFFGFSPKDAAVMDPQHRLFHECAWEALEQAGHPISGPSRFRGSVGVFAGCGMNAYFMYNVLTNPDLVNTVGVFLLRHTGNDRDFLPTGVSYKLNLRGPSVAVQTACSTSLVATHMACQSLLSGECDMALAGGVTIQVPHGHGYLYRENEVHSPDGHCRAFDAKSAGTVITNGVGAVVLRRLVDAIADGDPIHAVIKGSAINNDGSGKVGFLAPSVDGHASAVVEALGVAGFSAEDISYIEAHGTGTAVGDPIEIAALTEAFRKSTRKNQFCPIGSVKASIGHLDTAAGVASLIKVALALKHGRIPPSINYEQPNPRIDFEHSPFFVNTELREWSPPGGVRRAGISSLGVGGTNAHVIVEEAPLLEPTPPGEPWQLLTLSAKTPTALDAMTTNLADHLDAHPELNFADIAHTMQVGREPFEHRRVLAAKDRANAIAALRENDAKRVVTGKAGKTAPSVVFMFPGGGTQYPNMGRGLYDSEPEYRAALDACLSILKNEHNLDLRPLLFPPPGGDADAAEQLRGVTASIGAIFSVSYAMAQLWISRGIQPDAMTGHSLGEYVAACLAGVVSLDDALRIVVLRGRLLERIPGAAMMSVPLPENEVIELLNAPEFSELDLAAVNGPSLCLVSGRNERLDALEATLVERELQCRRLHIAAASHCRLLDSILDEFHAGIAAIPLKAPNRRYVSNVTGTWIRPEDARNPEYWVRHFRHCVRFSQGLQELLRDGQRVLLEVGPGQALSSLARQQEQRPAAIVNSLRHPDEKGSDRAFFLTAAGRLWIAGVEIDWLAFRREDELRAKVVLPTYPFERQRYWIEPGKGAQQTEHAAPALRKHSSLDDWFARPVWKRTTTPDGGAIAASQLQTWLIFLDATTIGTAIAERLEAQGHTVITVREGDAFYKFNDRAYAIAPEEGRAAYDQLISDLAAAGRLPDRIAHLWLLTAEEKHRPGSSFYHHCQERGFYSILFLMQALGEQDLPEHVQIDVITNGLHAVGGESMLHPSKATVLGALRVIPHEFSHLSCRSIDVELPGPARRRQRGVADAIQNLAGLILAELRIPATGATIAYRNGARFEQTNESISLPAPDQDRGFREGGAYLITGGLGGIGLTVAEHLAAKYRAKLILVGRTGLPERDTWDRWLAEHSERDPVSRKIERIRAMEAGGASVMPAAADVANIEAMRTIINEGRDRFGEIHGVIHAAGAMEDGVILAKTPEQVENVFTPKVHGTILLSDLFRGESLDFFVLFSSTSAILGPPGQVDYTAANCFLDAFAESRANDPNLHPIAINWGVWKEVGRGREIMQRMRGREIDDGRPRRRTAHPLLEECLGDQGGEVEYRTALAARRHWILDEHRTAAGRALIPGTGYLELAHGAVRDLNTSDQSAVVEIRDIAFIAPLDVDDEQPREMRLRLARENGGASYRFDVESREVNAKDWNAHAQGSVLFNGAATPPRMDITAITRRCPREKAAGTGEAFRLKQSDLLRFGPRWNVLRRARFGEHEAVAELTLPQSYTSDLDAYALHPAMLDLATGFALPLIEGYDQTDSLYVPMGYGTVRVYGQLTPNIVSHVRSSPANHIDRETAEFDITIADERGTVLIEIERFSVRKMSRSSTFAAPSAPAAVGSPHATLSAGERLFLESFEAGIDADEGIAVLERVVAAARTGVAGARLIASPVDLGTLMQRTDEAAAASDAVESGVKFERPQLQSQYEAPRDEIEETLAEYWEDLLGVNDIGIHDDFFELGGHSLIAVRLFAKVKKHWSVEYPLSVLFEAPTIAKMADMLREELGVTLGEAGPSTRKAERRFRHLVPMNKFERTDKPPFFLVAGMFGNVLNLRHLASQLSSGRDADQPVIAIQARGLYGDDKPHERFEDMARDYLAEIREVQPHGPYFLGGFSGGGLTAFEMAHQLRDAGEEIGVLIMLDSIPPRLPPVSRGEKLKTHWINLRREGVRYISDWAKRRIEWEMRRFRREEREITPAEFRSEEIEAGFRAACAVYEPRVYDGPVHLFRPPLDECYPVAPGRTLNHDRELVDEVNHWAPYITGRIDVHIVPGDHDGMVLEPHVRVLAAELRAVLEEAHRAARDASTTATGNEMNERDSKRQTNDQPTFASSR